MSRPRARELSPRGPGGLSVLAVEGPGAVERVGELCGAPSPPLAATPLVPRLVRLAEGGEALDEAIVLVEGRERVELHVHGSTALVARLLGALGGAADAGAPARQRAGGEPPMVAFEALARELVPTAPCEAAARMLLDQAEGALRRELEGIAGGDPGEAAGRIGELLERGRQAAFLLHPPTVVLWGPVNAGKSTLFNVVVGARRTVTSAEEGTTRDVVCERAHLGDWPIELCDTAGEGEPGGVRASAALERSGQRAGRRARRSADLAVWLDRAGRPPPGRAGGGARVVAIRSCDDRPPAAGAPPEPGTPSISALERPEEAARTLERLLRETFALPEQAWREGAGVPFEEGLRARLAGVGALSAGGLPAALEGLIAAPPPPAH